MIKTLTRLLSRKPATADSAPHVISSDHHPIRPGDISSGARRVVETLQQANYAAYVVGGCVRDLLLGHRPKDFDVATNATPEQVERLFRGARIIGRRFKIVHVRMGREIVEVTTFRGQHDDDNPSSHAASNDHGMLLRDNIYGTIDQDAIRRDFTVNAIYYQPADNSLYDFANGLSDIKKRTIRVLGDPEARYREDPVRMLRAVRFGAKLGFTIEKKSLQPIARLGQLLQQVPPARLFDEVVKLMMSGQGLATFHLLRETQLFGYLFPATERAVTRDPHALAFVEQAITNTDLRIRQNKRVTPAFIYAALLWPVVVAREKFWQQERNVAPGYAMHKASSEVIGEQIKIIAIPRRFSQPIREIWELQGRLQARKGKQAERLLEHPRFRAGYDFVLLREESGEDLDGLGEWWTQFQSANPEKREQLARQLPAGPSRRRRRRGGRRKPRDAGND